MKMLDVECEACGYISETLVRSDGVISPCAQRLGPTDDILICGGTRHRVLLPGVGSTANVAPDDIPGGVWIKHGICNPDGTPKRYDTRSSMRDAAKKAGLELVTEPIPVLNENIERALQKNHNQNARWSCPGVLTADDEAARVRAWHEHEARLQHALQETPCANSPSTTTATA